MWDSNLELKGSYIQLTKDFTDILVIVPLLISLQQLTLVKEIMVIAHLTQLSVTSYNLER